MSSPSITHFLTSSANFNSLLKPATLPYEGFANGQLYVLFGTPKVSKTTVCLDTALNAIKKGARVLYVDGDMGGLNFVRLNEMLTHRKDEKGIPPPLPNEVFLKSQEEIKDTFCTYLEQYGFYLYVAKSIQHFKNFHSYLDRAPHLVIIDSATLFFRQEIIQGSDSVRSAISRKGSSAFGAGVKTVDYAATTVRTYINNGFKKDYPAPDGAACGILTAQTKSKMSTIANRADVGNRIRQGEVVPLRERQVSRPFIGGEGLGYLSDSFIEIFTDSTDRSGKRRIAEVWGSRNLKDHEQIIYYTTDKGLGDK